MLATLLLQPPIYDFEGCLDSNPECCRNKRSSDHLSHPPSNSAASYLLRKIIPKFGIIWLLRPKFRPIGNSACRLPLPLLLLLGGRCTWAKVAVLAALVAVFSAVFVARVRSYLGSSRLGPSWMESRSLMQKGQ